MYPFKNSLLKTSVLLLCSVLVVSISIAQTSLKIVLIRHGEKPSAGDNLNCKGLNRSLLIPAMITGKFGVPSFLYVPSLGSDISTKHARMFQTISPLAIKYNLAINSEFDKKDSSGIVADILKKTGTVLVVWDHKNILPIVHAFGIKSNFIWADDDFEHILIITFSNGSPVLSNDTEGLKPVDTCN